MQEGIEITLETDGSTVSDFHKSILCLIHQTNISNLNAVIHFPNQPRYSITHELDIIEKSGIKISTKPPKMRFHLSLQAGDIFSLNFLYKALRYLKENNALAVSPEYSFRRMHTTNIYATAINNTRISPQVSHAIIDRKKLTSKTPVTLSGSVIPHSCSLLRPSTATFNQYLKTIASQPLSPTGVLFDIHLLQSIKELPTESPVKHHSLKQALQSDIQKISGKSRILRAFTTTEDYLPTKNYTPQKPYISTEIKNELSVLSNYNYDYKGYESMSYYDISAELDRGISTFLPLFFSVCQSLPHNSYSYVMLLPWIISGGADLFAINYLNTIAELHRDERILVALTEAKHNSLTKESIPLKDNIDVLNLSKVLPINKSFSKYSESIIYGLLYHLKPSIIHIMASKAAYDCTIKYGPLLRKQGSHFIFSSYNYLVGEHGDYFGYTVQELPQAYQPGDIVTTDNEKSKELWITRYGFVSEDILVHNQKFNTKNLPTFTPTTKNGINILWAAHIRPEKNPTILLEIAENLQKDNINIDCYGAFNPDNWKTGKNPLDTSIKNLHYKGSYHNFFKDIDISQYDIFLYTSHSDGTPNIILEVGLCGLPIISTAIGGIPNVVGGDATLVYDSNSVTEFITAIKSAISNRENTLAKSKHLQKVLREKYSDSKFTTQVQTMLKRSHYE